MHAAVERLESVRAERALPMADAAALLLRSYMDITVETEKIMGFSQLNTTAAPTPAFRPAQLSVVALEIGWVVLALRYRWRGPRITRVPT